MIRLAACAAIALFLVWAQEAQAADSSESSPASGLVEHTVKTKLKNYEQEGQGCFVLESAFQGTR